MATETQTTNKQGSSTPVVVGWSFDTTNGELIRQGLIPCEVNPDTGGLSRTGDPAHALAVFTITGKGFESRHVCRECALKFYSNRPIKEGVLWS